MELTLQTFGNGFALSNAQPKADDGKHTTYFIQTEFSKIFCSLFS